MAYMDIGGLYQEWGPEQTVTSAGGEYSNSGDLREIQVKINLASVGTASAIIPGGGNIFFPAGVRIEEVEVVVETAATGATAVLNVGLIRTDRTTAIDADGLIAALALTALDAAGEKTVLRVGSTGAGALIGTTTANVGHIVADWDTAAFTAGVIIVRIRYRKP